MNLVIHAEVEGGEAQNVYEGKSAEEAIDFIEGLENITVLQVNLSTMTNGEARSLMRSAKGADAESLTADTVAWLEENNS